MKLKWLFLLVLLLVFASITIKPFQYIKDIVFYPVHAINSEIELSSSVYESVISNIKEDLKELEELNNVKSISDFNMIKATVISRNVTYWFNTLTINKGSNDGINIDMAVIDSNGLIGRINSVTKNTATIKLITTNDVKNKVSAVIRNNKEDVYGIINGYDSKNNLLNLIISDNKKIEKGSIVETTGMGGIFPRGILIGKVYDVIKKEDDVTNVVRVSLSSNIEGARYVIVLQRKEVSTN